MAAALFIWRLEFDAWRCYHHRKPRSNLGQVGFFPAADGCFEAFLLEPGPVNDPFVLVRMENRIDLFEWIAAHYLMPVSQRTCFTEVRRYIHKVIRYEKALGEGKMEPILGGQIERATIEAFEYRRAVIAANEPTKILCH